MANTNEMSITLKELASLKGRLDEREEQINLMDEINEDNWHRDITRIYSGTVPNREFESPVLKSERESLWTVKKEIESHKTTQPKMKSHVSVEVPKFSLLLIGVIVALLVLMTISFTSYGVAKSKHTAEENRVQAINQVVDDVLNNPGTAWDEWSQIWTRHDVTWELLVENWNPVYENWKSRGVDVSTDYIQDVWDGITLISVTYSQFKSELFGEIRRDFKEKEPESFEDSGKGSISKSLGFTLIFAMFVYTFTLVFAKREAFSDVFSFPSEIISTNRINKKYKLYNETQFPVEAENYQTKLNELQEKEKAQIEKVDIAIAECVKDLRKKSAVLSEEVAQLEEEIDQDKFDIYSIREYTPTQLNRMAELIDKGRADSFKEALNMMLREEDAEMQAIAERAYQEELAAEAEYRREQQHNQMMSAMKAQANATIDAKLAELKAEYNSLTTEILFMSGSNPIKPTLEARERELRQAIRNLENQRQY